jgi:hypothetical protein
METHIGDLRRVAADWHGGQSTPLYAFASSGAVVEGVAEEIEACLETASPEDRAELKQLLVFVEPEQAGQGDWHSEHAQRRLEVGDGRH